MKSLSHLFFEIFETIARLTFDLSNVMAPNESSYMISYMSTIQMKSLSHVFFEIFETIARLTFDLLAPNESSYVISYVSIIQEAPISLIVFEKIAHFTKPFTR